MNDIDSQYCRGDGIYRSVFKMNIAEEEKQIIRKAKGQKVIVSFKVERMGKNIIWFKDIGQGIQTEYGKYH